VAPSTPPTDTDPLLGRTLDERYRVDAQIGASSSSRIYRGIHAELGEAVTIEALSHEIDRARLDETSQALAKLRHPHVATLLELGQTEGGAYLVTAPVTGESLADLLADGRTLEPARLVPLASQIAAALAAAHALDLVHGAIEPGHVFVEPGRDASEQVKILGFGVSTLLADDPTGPEPALDVRALGQLLHRALSGREATQPEVLAELELPTGLAALITRALADAPDDPAPRMDDLAAALAELPVSAPHPAKPSIAERHPVLALLAFLYIAQSHLTDDDLDPSELLLIAQQLHAWKPKTTMRQIKAIIAHARADYDALDTRAARYARKHEVTEALGARLNEDQRRHVLGSMWRIAGADGRIIDAEREFITATIGHLNQASPSAASEPAEAPEPTEVRDPESPVPRARTTEPTQLLSVADDAGDDAEPRPQPALDTDVLEDGTAIVAPLFETAPFPAMDPAPADAPREAEPDEAPEEPTMFMSPAFDADEPPPLDAPTPSPAMRATPTAPPLITDALPATPTAPLPIADAPKPAAPVAIDDAPATEPIDLRATELAFPSDAIREQVEQCHRALAELLARAAPLDALAAGPLARRRDSASVLRLEFERDAGVRESLLTQLDTRALDPATRLSTALLVLELDPKRGVELLFERAKLADANDDGAGLDAIIGALELGAEDEQRAQLLLRGHADASPEQRPRWLLALDRQAIDPGPEILAAALASPVPQTLAAGLRLLAIHADRDAHAAAVLPQLFAPAPAVRSAAILAGLVLDLPQAPILLGLTAPRPGMSICAYLHACSAPSADLDRLLADPSDALDFALALAGRRPIIDAIVERSGEAPAAPVLAGLHFATGFDGEPSALASWWAERRESFDPEQSHVGGQPSSGPAIEAALRAARPKVWSTVRVELLARSRGAIRLPDRGLPDALLAALDGLGAELDASP